jgi:hypothetical protein
MCGWFLLVVSPCYVCSSFLVGSSRVTRVVTPGGWGEGLVVVLQVRYMDLVSDMTEVGWVC